MRVTNPRGWVTERLADRRPFFTVRVNDGEMICMYGAKPEGALLGTDANPAYVHADMGRAYVRMLEQMAARGRWDDLLLGCSWGTDRADEMGRGPFDTDVRRLGLDAPAVQWADEHWPLDGVVNGSTVWMLERLKVVNHRVVLVTCPRLAGAGRVLRDQVILAPQEDSWTARGRVHETCRPYARDGFTFVWCAGGGLKPTAWDLYREYPWTSHLDLGHLFNGALGLRDYGWLQRQDGPWYRPYFNEFVPWFERRSKE